jgi:hypothetical protein
MAKENLAPQTIDPDGAQPPILLRLELFCNLSSLLLILLLLLDLLVLE